jgi:hypothetical protein
MKKDEKQRKGRERESETGGSQGSFLTEISPESIRYTSQISIREKEELFYTPRIILHNTGTLKIQ